MRISQLRSLLTLVVLATLALSASSVIAGARDTRGVYVSKYSDGSGWAQGSMGLAHNSSDIWQSLSCWVDVMYVGSQPSMGCSATDASNNRIYCWSSDPSLVQTAAAADSDSWVSFWVNQAGGCTSLNVTRSSEMRPKAH